MSAFKFNCPSCDARMEAGSEHVGMEIDCPHCSAKVTIPAPAPESAAAASPQPVKPAGRPGAKPAAMPEPHIEEQVASLSTEFKIGLVQAVREIIGDGTRWVMGRDGAGKQMICAKLDGAYFVPLPPGSKEATHYSIIGAFLHVMVQRKVMVTADGRSRMLSEEIPDAATKALGSSQSTGGMRLPGQKGPDPLTLDHAQCLVLLDAMETKYEQMLDIRVAAAKTKGKSKTSLGPLTELLSKSEDPLEIKDLAVAIMKTSQGLEERLQITEAHIADLIRQLDLLRSAGIED